jgi:S-adenosylmethionine decarboxylase
MDTLGRHLLIELWGCRRATDDCDAVRRAIVDSVEAVKATILHLHVHAFSPYGITGVAVLAESHLSIHTWPECGYVAADVFTCGETAEPLEAVEVLRRAFQAERVESRQLLRGVAPPETAAEGRRPIPQVVHSSEDQAETNEPTFRSLRF